MSTIISWNVNGLRAVHRKGNIQEVFHMKPDILCLQETKVLPEQLPEDLSYTGNQPDQASGLAGGYHNYFHFPTHKKGYSGVAVYTKEKPIEVSRDIGISQMDQEGRLIMAEYPNFHIINIYFPNGGGAPERLRYKLDFFDHFLEFANKLHVEHPNIILCGDFNVAHTPIDLARPKENETHVGFLPIERAWMDKLVSSGWVDVFRHFNPGKLDAYTYWDMKTFARERNVGWRIDYFFSSKEMLSKIKNIEIMDKVYGSDHCPIKLTLK